MDYFRGSRSGISCSSAVSGVSYNSSASSPSTRGWHTTNEWYNVKNTTQKKGGYYNDITKETLTYHEIAEQHKEVSMLMQFLIYKGYISQEEFDKFKSTYKKLEKL